MMLASDVQRRKFLVISNMRSGSTWLETTLGSLPDVAVDFEMKWGASYDPAPVHIMVDREQCTISRLLERIQPRLPVIGSKLTFDSTEMSSREFQRLAERIGRDVHIVHLTRDYRSVFLSIVRGAVHSINLDRRGALGAGLLAGLSGPPVSQNPKCDVSPEGCEQMLTSLFENDRNARGLFALGFSYLQVEYSCLARQFANIAGFVGSLARSDELGFALKNPVVNKLPSLRSRKIVANIRELEPIIKAFEKRRRREIWAPETRFAARLRNRSITDLLSMLRY